MSLLQQAIQLLSETPGNIVYHLVTLLTLQAVFAISLNQWRRDSSDLLAWRMTWAAGMIFLARIVLLAVGVVLGGDAITAVSILPPLEQATFTITAVLIVWALAPHSPRFPRLGHVLLLLTLITIGVMTLFFGQAWQTQALSGNAYNGSPQATIWGIVQIVLLTLGILLIISQSHLRQSLHLVIVSLLLLAHLANLWDYPEIIPTDTHIAYWVRLGHLVGFPLWAALAYRHSLTPLLRAQHTNKLLTEHLARSLQLSTQVISSTTSEETIHQAINMVAKIVNAVFVGIAILDDKDQDQLYLISNQPQVEQNEPRSWLLNLRDWPSLRLAMEYKQSVELMPNGLGARQLHDWYDELGIASAGALLIQPPIVETSAMGLLILGGPKKYNQWPDSDKELVTALASYLARTIDNRQIQDQANRQLIEPPPPVEPDTAVTGRIIHLEEERSHLQSELETTRSRLNRAEKQAVTASKQARDLAATLDELERIKPDGKAAALESEIEVLREALIEAEEAMAMAAAGEGGLSTEWVMLAITRYSGQLEEAQARLQALETELNRREQGPENQVVASLAQELRTPMTSITGYTDLLLSERIGILGTMQRDFLHRVQANTERMAALLEQIVQMTTVTERPVRPSKELVNVQEVVETAVSTVITQIREKHLRLDMDVTYDLPAIPINRQALSQIMTSLLGNACQSSTHNGRVTVTAQTLSMPNTGSDGDIETMHFIHLAVSDSGGGVNLEDRVHVFAPHHRADTPLIAGLGDTGAGLTMARTLTEANGGRIWVESQMGVGSTFSALFPIRTLAAEKRDSGATAVNNGQTASKGSG